MGEGGRIVCDEVYVWYPLLVSSPVTRVNFSQLVKLWGVMTVQFLREDVSLGQRREIPKKPRLAFAGFQVPVGQNNHCTKVTYFGVARPELLRSYFRVVYSLFLQVHGTSIDARPAGTHRGTILWLTGTLTPHKQRDQRCLSRGRGKRL